MTSQIPFLSIDPAMMYPLPSAKRFFGEQAAWNAARHKGLKDRIRYIGKRGFVSGKSLIEFIEEVGKTRDYSQEP